jgi:hypothetical protein
VASRKRRGPGCLALVALLGALGFGGFVAATEGWANRHLLGASWQMGRSCDAIAVMAPSLRDAERTVWASSGMRNGLREQLGLDWLGDAATNGVAPRAALWLCRQSGDDGGSVFSVGLAGNGGREAAHAALTTEFGAAGGSPADDRWTFDNGAAAEVIGSRLWIARNDAGDPQRAAQQIDSATMGPATLRSAQFRDAMDLPRGWEVAWFGGHTTLDDIDESWIAGFRERHHIVALGGAIYVDEAQTRASVRLVGSESSLMGRLYGEQSRNRDRLLALRETPLAVIHTQADPVALGEAAVKFGELLPFSMSDLVGLPGVNALTSDLRGAIERSSTGEFASAVLRAPVLDRDGWRAIAFVGLTDPAEVAGILSRTQGMSLGLLNERTVGTSQIVGLSVLGSTYELATTADGLWIAVGAGVIDAFVATDAADGTVPEPVRDALRSGTPVAGMVDLSRLLTPLAGLVSENDPVLAEALRSMRVGRFAFDVDQNVGIATISIER